MARAITDLDVSDVSDTILDAYIRDGYDRFMALERRWPWLEASYTLNTLANQSEYLLSGIGDVREITAFLHDSDYGSRIEWRGHDEAERAWQGSTASIPYEYSKWAGNIRLWPTPNAVYALALRGYRNPTAWYDTDSTEVDADVEFHMALVYYAVSLLYQLQEDIELAQYYRRSFDEAIMLARGEAMRMPQSAPLILHGARRRWLRPNRLVGS